MASYRLLTDRRDPVGEFEAPDDTGAELIGRRLSQHLPVGRAVGFRIERLEDGTWRSMLAWVPAPLHRHPVGPPPVVPRPRTVDSVPAGSDAER